MTKKPKDNVNAAEDFLDIVTTGHILTVVMTYLEMTSLNDTSSEAIVSREVWMEDDNVRRKILEDISSHIVNTHIDLTTAFKQPQDKAGAGTVYDYACAIKKYAIEALTLLSQYSIILPPNLAEQLKWSRFVNMHGRPGHNISCDLHMEHTY